MRNRAITNRTKTGDFLWGLLHIYPITAAGRIIGGFTMFVGISTFAVVTARVAQFLVVGEGTGADGGGDAIPAD